MRAPATFKYFIAVCAIVFIFYVFTIIRPNYESENYLNDVLQNFENSKLVTAGIPNLVHDDLKYILLWTTSSTAPFSFLEKGRTVFVRNKCRYTNCYVTDNRTYFLNITDFDAVVFQGKDLLSLKWTELPKVRSVNQKYIFAMMESPHYYPVCEPRFDGYFNWTWTYRLDSDIRLGYITAYDLEGRMVAPRVDMHWPEHFNPLSDDLKVKLKSKTKAAAWFVSNCKSKSRRDKFAKQVIQELSAFNLKVDIYGECGSMKCPRSNEEICGEKLKTDYYFYFSFENSFAEDYVTEKVLTALNNLVVPVVFGDANYSRFLPPGSYLNGKDLGASELARTMAEIISDPPRYQDMFRWHNHYRYTNSVDVDICSLCELMNDEEKLQTVSVHHHFRDWWNIKAKGDRELLLQVFSYPIRELKLKRI